MKIFEFLSKKWVSVLCVVLLLATTISPYFISFIDKTAVKGVFTFIDALIQTLSLAILSIPILKKKSE